MGSEESSGERHAESPTVESVERLIETALASDLESFPEQTRAVSELWKVARWHDGEVGELAIWGLGELAREHPTGGVGSGAANYLDKLSKDTPRGSRVQRLATRTLREVSSS